MKKLVSLFLALILCLSLTVFAGAAEEEFLIYDEANLLTYQQEHSLNEKLTAISRQHNAQIFVVTVASLDVDVDDFVEYLYDSAEMGYGENRDGVLLLVCMDPREYRILSNGFAGRAITVSEIETIGSIIQPDLSDGDFAAAFQNFAEECDYYLGGYLNGFPYDFSGSLIIALIVGLLVGIIGSAILKGQLKSVRQQNHASAYVKSGSMQVTTHNDFFLYRNITRTRKASSSSSGSRSGSSRSVGGGSF